jgi:hypothetical protein
MKKYNREVEEEVSLRHVMCQCVNFDTEKKNSKFMGGFNDVTHFFLLYQFLCLCGKITLQCQNKIITMCGVIHCRNKMNNFFKSEGNKIKVVDNETWIK